MPPKGQRRPSISSPLKDGGLAVAKPAVKPDMPPPPLPQAPKAILEPELDALQTCLKNTVVKTGQIYSFYADAKRLGIDKYAPHPPRSLTASLGREVEKYDQLCDAMESRINRAIAVLKRDIAREEARIQAEEAAAAAAAAAAAEKARELALAEQAAAPPPSAPGSPKTTEPSEPSSATSGPSTSPHLGGRPPGALAARRQSTVALSSLQRPNFPHKLDLSSASLRTIPDDVLRSGLSSPVTLAPKSSARALPPDLLITGMDPSGASVDIDLAMDIDMQHAGGLDMDMQSTSELDHTAGNSADKPIELDLDMEMDLFSNTDDMHANNDEHVGDIFSQLDTGGGGSSQTMEGIEAGEQKDDSMTISNEIFDALNQHPGAHTGDGSDIFAHLESHTQGSPTAMDTAPTDALASTSDKPGEPDGPYPGSLLGAINPARPAETHPGGDQSFNFDHVDLSQHIDAGFFSQSVNDPNLNNMTIEDIFEIGAPDDGKPREPPQADASQSGT